MSMCRRCDIWRADDNKWYMILGDHEHAEYDEDCTAYGPFDSEEAVERELDRHSNPGSSWVDPSGKRPPPTEMLEEQAEARRQMDQVLLGGRRSLYSRYGL